MPRGVTKENRMTPEGKVKAEGRKICKELGIYYFPVNQSGIGRRGIPDDVLCAGGMFVHIEYKAHMVFDKKNITAFRTLPTDLQVERMDACRNCKGITLVVDDVNIEYLKRILLDIRYQGNPMHNYCEWEVTLEDFKKYKNGELDVLSFEQWRNSRDE